jgi:exodeoxyribonuclease VII large subunit
MALLPKRLAIISQADSKGYSDFIVLLNGHPKRYRFDTFLFDATLQGDSAIHSIQSQLNRIEKVKHLFDAVVIIRGGGGEIGMHCYNNYELSKRIATFPLPILTGIGHSTNVTVCEMVAFRHGITPSDIAYFLIGIMEELDAPLDEYLKKLPAFAERFLLNKTTILERNVRLFHQDVKLAIAEKRAFFQQKVHQLELQLADKASQRTNELLHSHKQLRTYSEQLFVKQLQLQKHLVSLFGLHAKNRLSTTQNELTQAHNSFVKTGAFVLVKQRDQLKQFDKTIQLMHPINVLKRGYSIVTNQSGVLSENNNPTTNTTVTITTAFGALDAIITKETTPL